MKKIFTTIPNISLISASITISLSTIFIVPVSAAEKISAESVLNHYADIAYQSYQDSWTTAQNLHQSLQSLVAEPTVKNLTAAKKAWKTARIPYQQTEVYRFGNAIVDDWEGKVNAWPLDEGLIDYVAPSYGASSEDNALYTANVIANPRFTLSGEEIDATTITKTFLANTLHEVDGVEANVATGYHAIEFLLWGQDLNGTNAGAGNRPVTDFDVKNCSWGNCQRRVDYLLAASDLLMDDLAWMVKQWLPDGDARKTLLKNPSEGINAIFTGMGSLSYGELAGERIKLGVLLHDPEEEHDCFSDNTHNSHFYDIKGIQNVYTGTYTAINGDVLNGPSLSQLVASSNKEANKQLIDSISASLMAAQVLVDSAEKEGVAYDQLLAENNANGNAKVLAVVDALLEQTQSIENAVAAYGLNKIEFEGSDSLDKPRDIFK